MALETSRGTVVLYVDPDPDARARVRQRFAKAFPGATVATVDSADAAREYVRDHRVDCVVAAGSTGVDAIRLLETLEAERDGLGSVLVADGSDGTPTPSSVDPVDAVVNGIGALPAAVREATDLGPAVAGSVDDGHGATLEAMTERLDSVVTNVPVILFALDPDGTFTFSEGAGLEKLGFEPGEVVGESVFDVYADHAGIRSDATRALDGEAVESVREIDDLFFETTYRPVFDGDGDLKETIGVAVDVTDREHREEELRRYETIVQALADPVYALDESGRIRFGNDAIESMTGYDVEDLVGEHISTLMTDRDLDRAQELIRELLRGDEEYVTFEMDLLTSDGDAVATENHMAVLSGPDGEFRGTAGVVRDVTERKRREEQLENLNEISRELGSAEDRDAIAQIACRRASEKLNLPLCTVYLYDETTGTLVPQARTGATGDLVGERPPFDPDSDALWRAYFENQEVAVDADGDDLVAHADVASGVVFPLGKHGVFSLASTNPDGLTEIDRDLARLLVGHVEVALARVERERALREQTERLEDQKEQLEGLDRINQVIRDITRVLVQATTREDVEEAVCTYLSQADPYRLAWIGRQETVGGPVVPRAAAGDETEGLESIVPPADDADGPELVARAVETGEPQVEDDLRTDPPVAAWRAAALRRGYRSMVVVPVRFRETRYGVVCLYADRPDAFDQEEVSVLGELGEVVGYAINAIDSRKALVGDTAVQLEFAVDDPDLPATWGVEDPEEVLELKSIVRRSDGTLRAFFTITGASPDRLSKLATETTEVTDVDLVTERDGELLFESTLTESSFLRQLLEYGAHPAAMTVGAGGSTVTVELPQSADVTAFIDTFLTSYEDADLVARREKDRPIRTRGGLETAYRDRLTSRQLEVLETAYHSGYFEWPRESTGEDVADVLGVSQPTVNRHVREGTRRLFELVFDDDQ